MSPLISLSGSPQAARGKGNFRGTALASPDARLQTLAGRLRPSTLDYFDDLCRTLLQSTHEGCCCLKEVYLIGMGGGSVFYYRPLYEKPIRL
jgi:hypothetical protein